MDEATFQRLLFSSAPLLKVLPGQVPSGHASACLIDYRGKRILLTAAHATRDGGSWAVQTRYIPGKSTQLYGLGALHYLREVRLGEEAAERDIDFAYVVVPDEVAPQRQEIDPVSRKVTGQAPITIHSAPFAAEPTSEDRFGFCGLTKLVEERHPGQVYVSGDLQVVGDMTFLRAEDDWLVFKLPTKHPGHEYFRGCSGAPILNGAGLPVALVCEGREETDEIYGVSLRTYQAAIDILIDHG